MEVVQVREWCKEELCRLLGSPVDDQVVNYLMSMPSEDAIEEYIDNLFKAVDGGKQHRSFLREYLVRWKSLREKEDLLVPLKRLKDDQLVLFETKKSKNKKSPATKGAPPPGFEAPQSLHRSKPKYVPLMSSQGQDKLTVNIPGRHPCQCLGQKHDLINNCLECGRIVCSQEGSGPCLFCGSVVFTREEEQILSRDSRRAEKLKEKMWSQYEIKGDNPSLSLCHHSKEFTKATEHRDKLLEFDRTSKRRTKVVDDESDYFTVNSQWISEERREALQKKEAALREAKYGKQKGIKITLDIAGRQVKEEDDKMIDLYCEDNLEDLQTQSNTKPYRTTHELVQEGLYNTSIPVPPPVVRHCVTAGGGRGKTRSKPLSAKAANFNRPTRLQDRTILEMRDEGKCLSMHQPWASLLVCGIKRFEGRSWYGHHRGKLWIASTAKKPDQADIDRLEKFYSSVYDNGIEYPEGYPSSCLLGSVDIVDCLSLEECKEKYPDCCESESNYIFVCENPQVLLVKFPIKGKHKIWKLDPEVHTLAKQALTARIH